MSACFPPKSIEYHSIHGDFYRFFSKKICKILTKYLKLKLKLSHNVLVQKQKKKHLTMAPSLQNSLYLTFQNHQTSSETKWNEMNWHLMYSHKHTYTSYTYMYIHTYTHIVAALATQLHWQLSLLGSFPFYYSTW